jgi:hypothetical protein
MCALVKSVDCRLGKTYVRHRLCVIVRIEVWGRDSGELRKPERDDAKFQTADRTGVAQRHGCFPISDSTDPRAVPRGLLLMGCVTFPNQEKNASGHC